jgi:hypothetical protein
VDRVTRNLLEDFVTAEGFERLTESEAFERFVNYCVISKSFSGNFNVDDVSCGSGDDTGLDGIAVIVNGTLVTSVEEIDDLAETNGYIEAVFVFTQAKTSSSFDRSDIGTFVAGVKDFFAENHRLRRNEFVSTAATLQQAIYDRSAAFRGNPSIQLYYVTTGTWRDDTNLLGRINEARDDLERLALFSRIVFTPVDAQTIQAFYRSTKNRVASEFRFDTKTVLPEMEGITEAYLGVLSAPEFFKLIVDEGGVIQKFLFYDNVRDFQGDNEVNREIRETLASRRKNQFAVLNNGVTVVAKSLRVTGNRFHIEDYQIVNGCQTSHVLFEHRDATDENVFIPVKVIATADDELTSAIITATNRQTQVKSEDLQALSSFQKRLEGFFQSFEGRQKLFYERRSKQFNGVEGIEKVRIIAPQQQIRAFASMFLDEPHRASRYYATLLRLVGDRIFPDEHRLEPYYASAFAHYRLEYLFRNGQIATRFKPARYHMLMAVRHEVGGHDLPPLGSREVRRFCESILSVLWDEGASASAFGSATAIIGDLTADGLTRDTVKTQAFTDQVIQAVGGARVGTG